MGKLRDQASQVLASNDRGDWTQPAAGLYPHQWLWDSCFIAIGLRHLSPQRAATELRTLLRAQWHNGMVPHMVFWNPSGPGPTFWQSDRAQAAPRDIKTSGITQPPMLAEACWQVASSLPADEGKAFLTEVYPTLVAYHSWLYRERDLDGNGLVALYHPWETGIDNAPLWMTELDRVHTPLWIRWSMDLGLVPLVELLLRRDFQYVASDERITTDDALRLTHIALGLRKRNYSNIHLVRGAHFMTESLSFNCIFAAAGQRLQLIASQLGVRLPTHLIKSLTKTEASLRALWSPQHGQFMHRNLVTGQLGRVEGIAKLLPLYAGCISAECAQKLVDSLTDSQQFWTAFPVPSVPLNSAYFDPRRYWQGPTWVNTNWLIIQGLQKYGYHQLAEDLRRQTLAMVSRSGCYEYFDPLDGSPAGVKDFSWTAALALDLQAQQPRPPDQP